MMILKYYTTKDNIINEQTNVNAEVIFTYAQTHLSVCN